MSGSSEGRLNRLAVDVWRSGCFLGLALDENLPMLLERAAGPDPGSGDVADVRRRARRHVWRRRAAAGAAVAALAVPGLFVTGRFQADDVPRWLRRTRTQRPNPGICCSNVR